MRYTHFLVALRDFFVSFSADDRAWAEWIAWQVEANGYSVRLQAWDFSRGTNFTLQTANAVDECDRTIAVFSPSYSPSHFTQTEWHETFRRDPQGKSGRLLIVRVREVQLPRFLQAIVTIDLVNLGEAEARKRLLDGVQNWKKPAAFQPIAGHLEPKRFPGGLPPVWNVIPRNPFFTGREELLHKLHESLREGGYAASLVAVCGMGGVGKTSLVAEYAYRYAAEYNVVWWVRSIDPAVMAQDYSNLAVQLGSRESHELQAMTEFVRQWLNVNPRWLLIFDNLTGPESLESYLPRHGDGHVLITSRNRLIESRVRVLSLDALSRDEAIALLSRKMGTAVSAAPPSYAKLCELVGGSPLALEAASSYIQNSAIAVDDYIELFRRRSTGLIGGVQVSIGMSLEKLESENRSAMDLLGTAVFFADDPIPRDLLAGNWDSLEFNQIIQDLRKYSLIDADHQSLRLHALVRAVLIERLSQGSQEAFAARALELVDSAFPLSPEFENQARRMQLFPHALAVTGHNFISEASDEKRSRLLNSAGLHAADLGQYSQAERLFTTALDLNARTRGLNDPSSAAVMNNLGTVLRASGNLESAFACTRRAMAIEERAYSPDDPKLATSLTNLGNILYEMGRFQEALDYCQRALMINERFYGRDHPDIARDLSNIGRILRDLGDLEGALQYSIRALDIDERYFGASHPSVGIRLNNLGAILRGMGRYDQALQLARRALDVSERSYGPSHPNVAAPISNMASVLKELGRLEEAQICAIRALDIDQAALGPDHSRVAADLRLLAQIRIELREFDAALDNAQRALEIDESALGPNHPAVASDASTLSLILHVRGEYDAARVFAERALQVAERVYGPRHPDTKKLADNLATLSTDPFGHSLTTLESSGLTTEASNTGERAPSYEEAAARIKDAETSRAKVLSLSRLGLTELPGSIWGLTQLEELDLSGNALTTVSDLIGRLGKLRILNLTGNQLSSLPSALIELAGKPQFLEARTGTLNELYVHDNPGLELTVLGPTWDEVHSARNKVGAVRADIILEAYFSSRGSSTRPLREAKLIVVGRGGVGKTSIIRRLKGDSFDLAEPETHGISISELALDTSVGAVKGRTWDFGGQHILHSMHEFFLTARSLYLLVLGSRDDMMERDAIYWLQLIRSYAGTVPVIIVLNKSGGRDRDIDAASLRSGYGPILDFISTECNEQIDGANESIERLRQALSSAVEKMSEVWERFPIEWWQVKEWLEKLPEPYLTYEEYRKRCNEYGVRTEEQQKALSARLHDLGVALNYADDPRLRNTSVLKPDWLANGIYGILRANDPRHGTALIPDAVLEVEKLEQVFKGAEELGMLQMAQYPREKWPFLLRLMELFELAFPLDEKRSSMLVPALLSSKIPPGSEEPSDQPCMRMRYEFTVVPGPLIARFIVKTFSLVDGRLIWRRGATLRFADGRARVWVSPDERWIYITVWGPRDDADDLLTMLRGAFVQVFAGYNGLSAVEHIRFEGQWVPRAVLERYPALTKRTGLEGRLR